MTICVFYLENITVSHPGDTRNQIFLFSTILEILEIEVSIIPRILEILEIEVSITPRILEISFIQVPIIPRILEILETEFSTILYNPGDIGNRIFRVSTILEILEILFYMYFLIFPKKARAEISRRTHQSMSRDLSYETDSGPKTKTVSGFNFQAPYVSIATFDCSSSSVMFYINVIFC